MRSWSRSRPRTCTRSPRRCRGRRRQRSRVAGLTAYRALFTRAGLSQGETVLVLGAGSGVATFAVPLAAQAGARVLVTSSSAEKIERARELGAAGGVDYTDGDWPEAVLRTRRRRRGCRPRLGRNDLERLAALPASGRPGRRHGSDRRRPVGNGRPPLLSAAPLPARDDARKPQGLRALPRACRRRPPGGR